MSVIVYDETVNGKASYSLTDPNTLCSDSVGKKSIETLEDCRNAVAFVQSIIPASFSQGEESPDYPKGCYRSGGGLMFFNRHSSGHRQSSSREVCISADTTSYSCLEGKYCTPEPGALVRGAEDKLIKLCENDPKC